MDLALQNTPNITRSTLKIAWISDFPIEWLPELPEELRGLPRRHPLTWQRVLLGELQRRPELELHVVAVRRGIRASVSFARQGVVYHVLKAPPKSGVPTLYWVDTFLIRRALRHLRPSVVHAWGTERGAGLIAARLGYPSLLTMQGILKWYGEVVPLHAYEKMVAILEGFTLKRAHDVTTESKFGVGYLRERYPRLSVHQVEHAPNWLFHRVIRKPRVSPLRLVCVGTLEYRKGTDVLLQALDQVVREASFELVLIGGGPTTPYMLDLKRTISLGLWNRIQFRPALTAEEVAKELALATMLVFPTRADTSPNAVKEAAVAGVPVVASKVGGIPDYIFPGKNGVLFAPGDVGACVEALRAAFTDPEFRRGIVDAATLKEVREYLSPAQMGERFSELYRELASPQPKERLPG